MHPDTDAFMAIFEGFKSGYGIYDLPNEAKPGEKNLGPRRTVAAEITKQQWEDHLMGVHGLGVVPINAESKCRFGAVDVDDYEMNLTTLAKNILDFKMPLVVCRTKSGGAHLYLFVTDFVDARLMQVKLKEMASFLGYGDREIFPKQSQLVVERGDCGSWLNMPYFCEVKTDRYAIGSDLKPIRRSEQFLKYVYSKTITPEILEALSFKLPDVLPGGPPCLQQLVNQGFPQGTRNNGLTNLAIYAKKAYPDNWEQRVDEYNTKFVIPPLTSTETLAIIKSVRTKDYNYTCKQQPIQAFCNAAICRTCRHGVGGADLGMPKMGTLSKLCTIPPIWFLDVETESGHGRLELSTEDLQSPMRFQNICMAKLSIMPTILKRDNWQEIVRNLLAKCTEIHIPPDTTPQGMLMHHLESFCTSRVQAKTVDEILSGKPWCTNNEIHFRIVDFISYLDRVKFKMELNKLQMHIREIPGYRKKFHNIKGKGSNCAVIPSTAFQRQEASLPIPVQAPDVM